MLAAAVLSGHADEVTVVERDSLPAGPEPRTSLPQARHVHVLWSGGVRAFEELLPGITDRWLAAGARRIPLPSGLVSLTAHGWVRRWPQEMQHMIACTRDLLDWVVRDHVLRLPGVTLLQRHELLGLAGSDGRVTGVRVRAPDGAEPSLDADLVVDTGGRGSRATDWLRSLGFGGIEVDEVDSGLVYASRLYRAPDGGEGFPVVNVQADPREPVPGRTATIVPVENGRWLVTLSGTRGGEPSSDPAEFESFARSVRHPVVGELIARATPLSDRVSLSRSTVNRRRYFERAPAWPDGFIVVGDAVATYNPVYAQGMSVAAQGLVELRNALRRHPPGAPGLARRIQRALAGPVGLAWELATSQDILYPGAVGRPARAGSALMNRYVNRLCDAATGRARVTGAFFAVLTLSEPVTAWLRPDVVLGTLRGPGRRSAEGPPLPEAGRLGPRPERGAGPPDGIRIT
ncbi:FAD-dependent monooxygenase [Streptomyces sp. NPDC051018]|uniref:FAD-dependent monooxygenase n=1 Tax=Streptomyces sp. NPDC051018 TaxID=3365639 RepID=UPI0037B09F78